MYTFYEFKLSYLRFFQSFSFMFILVRQIKGNKFFKHKVNELFCTV